MMYKKIFQYIHSLYEWVIGLAEHRLALVALCVVAFTEASVFLIPPDVLLIAMGASQPKKSFTYAFYCTLFSVLGALFAYILGLTLWLYIENWFLTYLITPEQFQNVQVLFQKNTFTTILLAAFTPIPFKVFTITAGVLQAPLIPFLLGSIIGRGVRFYAIGGLFFIFGAKMKVYIEKHFETATCLLGLLFVLILIYYYFR